LAEYSKTDIEKIKTDMNSLDRRLVGHLYRKILNKDLSKLTKEIYFQHAKSEQDKSEKEYVDFLFKKDIEILIKTEMKDFVVCLKDKMHLLVLCDRAGKEGVELVSQEDLKLSEVIGGI